MGVLPTATTSAEPLWIPFRIAAGARVDADPRETHFEELRRLTTDGAAGAPVWDEQGSLLRFVSPGACHAVVTIDLANGRVSRVEHAEPLASLIGTDAHVPTGCAPPSSLAPEAIAPVAPVSLGGVTNPEAWPTFTRDHRALAWQAPRAGSSDAALDIFIGAANGTRPRSLTRDGMTNINPTFCKDGRHLVFASDRDATAKGAALALHVIEPDGPLTSTGAPAIERISFGAGSERAPRFSPDGRWLAFLSSRGGRGLDLYVARWRD